MDVLELLPHYVIRPDLFWMGPFLPQLIITVLFVWQLQFCQKIKQGLLTTNFQSVNDLPRDEAATPRHAAGQRIANCDQMEVIFQNAVTE